MFKFIFCFLLLFSCQNLLGQNNTDTSILNEKNIIGVWQFNSDVLVSTSYKAATNLIDKNFRFYGDGKFVLTFKSEDHINRLRIIRGSYRLANGLLYLKIVSHDEIVGGELEISGTSNELFDIYGGKLKTIINKESDERPLYIARCKTTEMTNSLCIQIENEKYYKVSDNPEAYK